MRISAYFSILFLTINAAVLGSCGGGTASSPPGPVPAPMAAAAGGWLTALPDDTAQPWESVDGQGYVARGTSALPPTSEFQPGVERSLEGGSVLDLGEASEVSSGSSGSGELSYAVYRLTMGGVQPGALALDINLHPLTATTASPYYVAVSDYGNGYWKWLGPYTDGQLTLQLDTSLNYLSPLGNFFVAIGAYDGASFDIVGVLASQLDGADTTAPPAPTPPALAPVAGGLELAWTDVIAADLAGYRIHYSYSPFTASSDPGVQQWPHLENTTRFVLPLQPRTAFIALQAVDVNGNSSALSPVASALPLPGSHSDLTLDVTAPSVLLNEPATLSFSGADLFDIDANGDGSFEATDIPAGTFAVDTSGSGLIRPRVRGHDAGGTSVALGSVSLIVTGNQRPVAVARVDITSGVVPFDVNFIGSESGDDDGTIVEYAWDRTGNGSYENVSTVDPDTTGTYTTPGLYNVRLRVTDDQGAWDVDTVSVNAVQQALTVEVSPSDFEAGQTILLEASHNLDVASYDWDLNGNGTYETPGGTSAKITHTEIYAGPHSYGVQITLTAGGTLTASASGLAHGYRHVPNAAGPIAFNDLGFGIVDGKPAMAYTQPGAGFVYATATDSAGLTWTTPVIVDLLGGMYASLKEVDGMPAISYQRGTDLLFVRASSPDGSTWNPPQHLDTTNDTGWESYMEIINGNPAIAYRDNTASDAMYIRASNAQGTAWNPPVPVEVTVNDSGHWPCLAEINGVPAMAYGDYTATTVRYARALDPNGATWAPAVDAAGPDPNGPIGLITANGRAAIAYSSTTGGGVIYARARNDDGTVWPSSASLIDAGDRDGVSLTVVNGYPMLTCIDLPIHQWRFSRALDTSGYGWESGQIMTVPFGAASRREFGIADASGAVALFGICGLTEDDIHFVMKY